MKYIKKYETDNNIYNPGDMVKIEPNPILFPYIKIISKDFPLDILDNTSKVSIEFIRLDLNIVSEGRIEVKHIIGFCNEKEIEEYELKKAQIKFNI